MLHIGRIKVVEPSEENEMDTICVCPHCGNMTRYGDMIMYCGVNGCPNCHEELHETIEYDRQHRYETYVTKANNHEYEPYKYVEEGKLC